MKAIHLLIGGTDQRDGGHWRYSMEIESLVDAIVAFSTQFANTSDKLECSAFYCLAGMGKGEDQWHLLRPESMGSCSASLLCLSRQMQMVMTFFHSLSKSVRIGGCKTLWAPGWGCQVQTVMTFLNFQSNTGTQAHIRHSPTELLKPMGMNRKDIFLIPF